MKHNESEDIRRNRLISECKQLTVGQKIEVTAGPNVLRMCYDVRKALLPDINLKVIGTNQYITITRITSKEREVTFPPQGKYYKPNGTNLITGWHDKAWSSAAHADIKIYSIPKIK